MSFSDELKLAQEAAIRGGEAALAHFMKHVDVRTKDDDSPVSAADLASNDAILRAIADAYPDDAVLSEETEERPESGGRRWIIDPIDGTRAFLRGLQHWGVLVALEVDGRVEVGVAHFPAMGLTWAAATGEGCRRNGELVRCSDVRRLEDATIQIGEVRPALENNPRFLEAIVRRAAVVRSYGDAFAACLVLDGRSDGWIEVAKTWDFAPFTVLAREAGAVFSDWSGADRIDTGTAIVAAPAVHAELIALAKSS